MIIIEGMDNSGKTTLCKHISEKFSLSINNRNRPYSLNEGFRMISNSVFKEDHMISDRHVLISELVYGPILRGKSLFGDSNWDLIWLILRTNPLFIYCRPSKKKIFDFGDREQMKGVIAQREELLKRYDWVMDTISLSTTLCDTPLLKYDYTDGRELGRIERKIYKHIGETDEHSLARRVEINETHKLEEKE